MRDKTTKLLLNILRVFLVTIIMFFGFSLLLYYLFYKGVYTSYWPLAADDSYFRILGRFFSLNWPDNIGSYPSREIFLSNLPGTRDLTVLPLLCGGIPGLVGGLKNRKEMKKKQVVKFIFLGFTIPLGVFFSFLSMHTQIFPASGIKSLSLGNPISITGSRIFDSLFTLKFTLFIDTLWHLFLPTICISFVTYCLALWLVTKTREDLYTQNKNWQRINIRLMFSYILFSLMLNQTSKVFEIEGILAVINHAFAWRDPVAFMYTMQYLVKFICVYLIFNGFLIIFSNVRKLQPNENETKKIEKDSNKIPFIQHKPNIAIIAILGALTVGYLVVFILSLLPGFNVSSGANLFAHISWGIRDSSLTGLEIFLGLAIFCLVILLPIAHIKNKKQSARQLSISQMFFLNFGRDLLLFLFIPYCILPGIYSIVINAIFGYFIGPIWYTLMIAAPFSITILLSIDLKREQSQKINLKHLSLRVLSYCCLIALIMMVSHDSYGNSSTYFLVINWNMSIWEKLTVRWPIAYLTNRGFVYTDPIYVIISGFIIWSFYAYWMLGSMAFNRLSIIEKQKIEELPQTPS